MQFCQEIFNWNLKYLKFVGILGDRKRAYFFVSMPVFLSVSAVYKTVTVLDNFDELIALVFIACGLVGLLVRLYVMVSKYERILALFGDMEKWHAELMLDNDPKTMQRLQEFTNISRKASKCLFTAILFAVLYLMAAQLFADKHLVEVYVPGIDVYERPYYHIISALEIFWLAPIGLLNHSAYMSTMLISIAFGIFLMRDLQQKLKNMNAISELEALKCIKKCMRQHALIIKYHQDLEYIFSFGNFIDVAGFIVIPCMIIVESSMQHSSVAMAREIQLVVIVSASTFFIFHLAGMFCYESVNISHAAYNCDWTNRGIEFRKYILLIIAMGQRPLRLTAGGLQTLNMETFMAIVRSTYSLFTILQGTMNSN